MHNYKRLVVWRKAMELTTTVYLLTNGFPKNEQFGLSSQMRRSAVSIASNISEGSLRSSPKEWRNFLHIAFGSGGELETQIEISKRLGFLSPEHFCVAEALLLEVMRMLNVMIKKSSV